MGNNTNETIELATHRLIDSVWTVGFVRRGTDHVKIVSYDRDNTVGYREEKTLLKCCVIEDDRRYFTGLRLYPSGTDLFSNKKQEIETLKVINQMHVFDY